MQQTRAGSGAKVETLRLAWNEEWREVAVLNDEERREHRARIVLVLLVAVVASAAAAVLPLTPGFAVSNAVASAIASTVVAALSVGVVLAASRAGGTTERFGIVAALASAGAAAIHFAVVKMHFDEYTLFGVFFVGSGIAQMVWPVWWLLRPWRPLLLLAAVGNSAIVALWAVDRIWGLPIGPTHWQPDPVGFGDVVSAAFEVALAGACIALLLRGRRLTLHGRSRTACVLAALVLTALGLMSALGAAPSLLPPAM